MDLDPENLKFVVEALMKQAVRDRVELYALRILLLQSCGLSPKDFDSAREIASKRYATLLRLVSEDPQEQTDLLEFLKAFEGPVQ